MRRNGANESTVTDNPNRHHRQSIRLRGYDYTQAGAYFVTIAVQNREHVLGEIVDGVMRLNGYGRAVLEEMFLLLEISASP
jgi:hypothetical protein